MKEMYFVRDWGDGTKTFAKIEGVSAYSYDFNKKEWIPNQGMMKIVFDITDYDEISKEKAYEYIDQINKEYIIGQEKESFKKLDKYDFREIVGHFILIKNTYIIKNPDEYNFIDEEIESIKQGIIRDTKEYYTNNAGYNEEYDMEDTFSLDALNEDMTTRKVSDLYEPLFGYVGIEKNRGLVVYLLGNKEDKLKYVYGTTYWPYNDNSLADAFVKIIDDEDFEYAIEFKNQIQNDEEREEEIIKTRDLKGLDQYRLKFSPDFVNCIVPYKRADYSAKVKLEKFENGIIYGMYHNQEGLLELVDNNKSQFLLFKPLEKLDDDQALKEYINAIIDGFKKDYDGKDEDIVEIIKAFHNEIENGYIKGDLPFEVIRRIMDEINDN